MKRNRLWVAFLVLMFLILLNLSLPRCIDRCTRIPQPPIDHPKKEVSEPKPPTPSQPDFAGRKQQLQREMTDSSIIIITGYFEEGESKLRGIERADSVKNLLVPDIDSNRIVPRAKRIHDLAAIEEDKALLSEYVTAKLLIGNSMDELPEEYHEIPELKTYFQQEDMWAKILIEIDQIIEDSEDIGINDPSFCRRIKKVLKESETYKGLDPNSRKLQSLREIRDKLCPKPKLIPVSCTNDVAVEIGLVQMTKRDVRPMNWYDAIKICNGEWHPPCEQQIFYIRDVFYEGNQFKAVTYLAESSKYKPGLSAGIGYENGSIEGVYWCRTEYSDNEAWAFALIDKPGHKAIEVFHLPKETILNCRLVKSKYPFPCPKRDPIIAHKN